MNPLLSSKEDRYYKEVHSILCTMKSKDDPISNFIKDLLKNYTILYLLRNPILFGTREVYDRFREEYMKPNDNVMLTEVALLTAGHSVSLINKRLNSQNQQLVNSYSKRITNDKNVADDTETLSKVNKYKNDTVPKLTEQHEQIINGQASKVHNIKESSLTDMHAVTGVFNTQQKMIDRIEDKILNSLTNEILLTGMLLRYINQPRYKIWHYTPNPLTRHSGMEGQVVRLEDDFEVVNDTTGDTDMMQYPGDWTGSPSNTANCMCVLEFCSNSSCTGRVV